MNAVEVDFSLLPDVVTEVQEHLPQLERDLHQLVHTPDSAELLGSAFRHMHTIKGDFGYCGATPLLEFVHRLESVLQAMRDGRFLCSALVAEALLQSMDLVQSIMLNLAQDETFSEVPSEPLQGLIDRLASARSQQAADQVARLVLLGLHGTWLEEENGQPPPPPPSPENLARAWALGQQLELALLARRPDWRGRAATQQALVLALNRCYPNPVDEETLKLAVCWHEVGLLALPDSLLYQAPQPSPRAPEWAAYAAYPGRSAAWLLAVAADCLEAAQIVRQHRTWANGKGIPDPEHSGAPHRGALMLACADLFHDRVAGLQGEEYRRGVLRTLFDVNAGLDTRFDALLVNAFAAVAKDFLVPQGE
ncbi:Hpt domain-containing protein [Chitinimonas lacunae]|uniref:Hpt domain-containing protein n=1 Tax=Chitinimonas lacunae TaxID=1963018 RepID=A0ABV8MUR9_9NEIS